MYDNVLALSLFSSLQGKRKKRNDITKGETLSFIHYFIYLLLIEYLLLFLLLCICSFSYHTNNPEFKNNKSLPFINLDIILKLIHPVIYDHPILIHLGW